MPYTFNSIDFFGVGEIWQNMGLTPLLGVGTDAKKQGQHQRQFQDFPEGDSPKGVANLLFSQNFPKLCKNEENWAEARRIRNLSMSIRH